MNWRFIPLGEAIKVPLRNYKGKAMFLVRGSQGSLVKALQEKLSQLGYNVGSVDGVFGPRTEVAVLKFQQEKGLDADGVVGNQTWQALFGSNIPDIISVLNEPTPERLCFDVFGDFRIAGWEEQNLARCDLSAQKEAFKDVFFGWLSPADKAFVHSNWFGFVCHRLVVPKFQIAFQNLVMRGLAGQLKTFDGCYEARNKRGGYSWSAHAWGIAMDLNATWNAFGHKNFEMTKEFAQCFKDVGFVWGGDWSYPDAMHFQYCSVR